MARIFLYDSTLRDGAQAEGVSFSLEDKLGIAAKLDELGVDYIEGGFPESNPKDRAFFEQARRIEFRHARLAVFGSTRRKETDPAADAGLAALLRSECRVVTLVGKAWDIHVADVLRTTRDENLRMITDSVTYLKRHDREVIFDAEHFFDGFRSAPDYALACVRAAAEAGADWIVLCDTNGGSLPEDISQATARVCAEVTCGVGFHGHNDAGLGTANSLAAVGAGARQVQGTINGVGERAGNADLCTVIPNLVLKMGHTCLPPSHVKKLTEVSRYVYEVANFMVPSHQPFVGPSAFAHKGGQHVDAVLKNPRTYEHVPPETVGNTRRLLVSELSGGATMQAKLDGFNIPHDKPLRRAIIERVAQLEHEGYQFEAAEASFELLVRRIVGTYRPFFDLHGFRVIIQRTESGEPVTEATLKVSVAGEEELTASEGNGPVNALDRALRKALGRFYPSLADLRLVDYKVRVIDSKAATAAKVRVFIESRDHDELWGTVGVSENIIEASWQALVDSVEYKLSKDEERRG